MSLTDKVEVIGGILVSSGGLHLAGELGIDKDIHIVSAMFNAVSNFIEDTLSRSADQIKLSGDVFITKVDGDHSTIWVTSHGTSVRLVEGVQNILSAIETKYIQRLDDWNGERIDELVSDFNNAILALGAMVGSKEDDTSVPVLGFSILDSSDPHEFEERLETAVNLYFMSGDMDAAYELAASTAESMEKLDPTTKRSGLFHALAVKVDESRRIKDPEIEGDLRRIQKLCLKQENIPGQIVVAHTFAKFHVSLENNDEADRWIDKAKTLIDEHGTRTPKEMIRSIDIELTRIRNDFHREKAEECIHGWQWLLDDLEPMQLDGLSDLEKFLIVKYLITINNNIGFVIVIQDRLNVESHKKAIPYYEKAIHHIQEHQAQWVFPIVAGNLGLSLAMIGELDRALVFVESAHQMAEEMGIGVNISVAERNMGVYYFQSGVHNNDISDLFEAMHWFKLAEGGETNDGEIEFLTTFKDACMEEIRKRV